ncbi:MAG: methyltransferase domain-containing protein [Robiginitomaculum sp.]|nr:methyltransferase domain-containing protein [Robiginitomaculum sp.]
MQADVRELSKFYQSRLGLMAKQCISRRLDSLWPNMADMDVLSLGYGVEFAESWQGKTRRLVCAMPAHQGAQQWPGSGLVQTTLIDPLETPFADNCFDRILAIHFLEEVSDPLQSLIEITRSLVAGGRLVVVVSHRIGLWSASSKTPFGHGRSFSLFQLTNLLEQAGLRRTARTQALFAPPVDRLASASSLAAWERTGEIFWPFFGGVLLVEAEKVRIIDPRKKIPLPVFCPESR